MRTQRIIVGARYTQALRRNQKEDFASALTEYDDCKALGVLRAMGYDISDAQVLRVRIR